jgi:hypothetical protein
MIINLPLYFLILVIIYFSLVVGTHEVILHIGVGKRTPILRIHINSIKLSWTLSFVAKRFQLWFVGVTNLYLYDSM